MIFIPYSMFQFKLNINCQGIETFSFYRLSCGSFLNAVLKIFIFVSIG